MNLSEIEIRITADGSTTLYRKDIDETYHSTHGALQEAQHVFIKHGLCEFRNATSLKILEIGFGTGLNALLSALYAADHAFEIEYHGLEALPLDETIWRAVNYVEIIQDNRVPLLFEQMHQKNWNELEELSPYFSIMKIHETLQNYSPQDEYFDLIYFDAFGPRAQEEMWHQDLLAKLYKTLKTNGLLTSYCAKGSYKRDLKNIGFQVIALPGPPGKREMTQARKILKL